VPTITVGWRRRGLLRRSAQFWPPAPCRLCWIICSATSRLSTSFQRPERSIACSGAIRVTCRAQPVAVSPSATRSDGERGKGHGFS
jgi:hypothetical protein